MRWPQVPQNLKSAGTGLPHAGQLKTSGAGVGAALGAERATGAGCGEATAATAAAAAAPAPNAPLALIEEASPCCVAANCMLRSYLASDSRAGAGAGAGAGTAAGGGSVVAVRATKSFLAASRGSSAPQPRQNL